jgi:hypothetical protein
MRHTKALMLGGLVLIVLCFVVFVATFLVWAFLPTWLTETSSLRAAYVLAALAFPGCALLLTGIFKNESDSP